MCIRALWDDIMHQTLIRMLDWPVIRGTAASYQEGVIEAVFSGSRTLWISKWQAVHLFHRLFFPFELSHASRANNQALIGAKSYCYLVSEPRLAGPFIERRKCRWPITAALLFYGIFSKILLLNPNQNIKCRIRTMTTHSHVVLNSTEWNRNKLHDHVSSVFLFLLKFLFQIENNLGQNSRTMG